MTNNFNICSTCPRNCKIDRNTSKGFCNEFKTIKIAKVIKNFKWEEPCITGDKGTLAIFFSGCNLRCDYCQNFEISRGGVGKEYSIDDFVKLIEENQENHSSIDLITPTHFSDQLLNSFKKISKKIPVVWNTNGYETPQNIKKVSSFVDVFLTDLKYSDNELGKKFSKCNNYFDFALPSLQTMCTLKPDIINNDVLQQGVMIRHLVLPGHIQNTIKILDIIKEYFPGRKLSLMSQFTPNGISCLNRKLYPIEYKTVLVHLEKLKLYNGYIQDIDSANENFVPNFE